MSKIRIERHNHYKKWEIGGEEANSPYPAEAALLKRLRLRPTKFFLPYQFPYTDDDDYHFYLAFLVEAVELLPRKIDMSFDAVWRAFEAFYKNCVIFPKDFKLQQEAPSLARKLDVQSEHNAILDVLLRKIPVQSCEYLTQRIFRQWKKSGSDSEKIWNRLNNPPNQHRTINDLLNQIAAKYHAPTLAMGDARKAAMLLRLALQGKEVNVGGSKLTVSRSERISFLANALLYTFRNDRFTATCSRRSRVAWERSRPMPMLTTALFGGTFCSCSLWP